MKPTFIILVLSIAFNSWGSYKPVMTGEDIDNLPVIVFINENDGQTTYRLHFRDTGRFKGLSGVTLLVNDEDETTSKCLFFGHMAMYDHVHQGVKSVEFILQENMIRRATLDIYTSQDRFSYRIPLSLIQQHFRKNITIGNTMFDPDPAIDEFLKEEFDGSCAENTEP